MIDKIKGYFVKIDKVITILLTLAGAIVELTPGVKDDAIVDQIVGVYEKIKAFFS